MTKIGYFLYQPYKWLIFLPFLAVSTLVFGSLAVLLSILVNQRISSLVGGSWWARINGWLTPISVVTSGRENIEKGQSYIVVANHQSLYDIFVLYGWLGIDFRWVMKKELRKIPGLGIGSEKVGHLFIDRSDGRAAMETIRAAKQKIVNGTSVIFFPEGTRSKDGKLGRFKRGAFRMAFELNLPVLPVTINGTDTIMPSGTLDILPGKANIVIHPPIAIEAYRKEDIGKLINRAFADIAAARE